MSARRLSVPFLGLAVAASLLLSRPVLGDCCVCSDCDGGEARCLASSGGCDGLVCLITCLAQQCGSSSVVVGACSTLPQCPQPVPVPAASASAVVVTALLTGLYLFRKRNLSAATRVAGLTITLLTCAAALYAISQLHVTGQWSAGAGAPLTGQPLASGSEWSADLNYAEDGTVSGQVSISGSDRVKVGWLTGTVSGNRVTGTISDQEGKQLAAVEGLVEGQTFNGHYTTPGGASGTFTWNVP